MARIDEQAAEEGAQESAQGVRVSGPGLRRYESQVPRATSTPQTLDGEPIEPRPKMGRMREKYEVYNKRIEPVELLPKEERDKD